MRCPECGYAPGLTGGLMCSGCLDRYHPQSEEDIRLIEEMRAAHGGHGGRRQGAGRKPLSPRDPTKRRTVTLTEAEVVYLRTIGNGNVSRGIRKLIDERISIHGEVVDNATR